MYLQIAKKLPIFIEGGPINQLLDEISGKGKTTVRAGKTFDPHIADLHQTRTTSYLRYIYMHCEQILWEAPLILTISSSKVYI